MIWRWALTAVGLITALASAAGAGSFAELRESTASLPGDSWWHPARVEVGYSRPAAIGALHAGWISACPVHLWGWAVVGQVEALQSPLLGDRRVGLGLEKKGGRLGLGALVLRRDLRITGLRRSTQRAYRLAALWREGRWSFGLRQELPVSGRSTPPLRWLWGVQGRGWRVRLRRRRSPYADATLWDWGFEIAALETSRLALRWGDAGSSLSVLTRRADWDLRLSAALDGARAGALGFAVRWH